MTAAAGREDMPQLPPAYRLVALEEVDSTNAEAKRLAAAGAEDGTLVWARRQSAGYGRQGRQWSSPEGNLFVSLIVRPDCRLAEAAQLSFLTAVALGEAIGNFAPPLAEVTFKWPNDVLLNGRKVAGILLESKADSAQNLEWLVIGLGVNVTSFPSDSRLPATSLQFEGCPAETTAAELLEALARHLLTWINRWLDEGFEPLRQAWLRHARGLGEEIEVRLPNETLHGSFSDLDPEGTLVLTLPGGAIRRIAAGDVYLPGEADTGAKGED